MDAINYIFDRHGSCTTCGANGEHKVWCASVAVAMGNLFVKQEKPESVVRERAIRETTPKPRRRKVSKVFIDEFGQHRCGCGVAISRYNSSGLCSTCILT